MIILYGLYATQFGPCLIALTNQKVCYLAFADIEQSSASQFLQTRWPQAVLHLDTHAIQTVATQIFTTDDKPDVHLEGSEFQKKVWRALQAIPVGTTASYQDIAQKIGKPKAHRAVASAIAKNQIAYLIPCHRVIQKSGKLGGYRWDTSIKKSLLDYESRSSYEASR